MKKYKIAVAFCLLPFSYIFAQEIVKGKVLSSNQKPLSGVTVTVSETGTTTTTDSNGTFQINDLKKEIRSFLPIPIIPRKKWWWMKKRFSTSFWQPIR
jgi:hypothetical protein